MPKALGSGIWGKDGEIIVREGKATYEYDQVRFERVGVFPLRG